MKRKIKSMFLAMISVLFLVYLLLTPKVVNAAVTSLSVPTTVKLVSSSYNSITVSWSGVSGAGGYQIYRATSAAGPYSCIKTTGAKSYLDTGLKTGKSYYYKIRAYVTSGSSRIYGKFTTTKRAKAIPATPQSVKAVSSSYNSITVSWNSVSGTSGYRIYRATSSTGTYSYIKSTTSKSYNDSGLITGKTYYYKVRAYRTVGSSKVYGYCSTAVKSKPVLPVPDFVNALTATDGVELSWDMTTGASGYEIYSSVTKDGTYQLLSTVSERSYSDTGLAAGTTHYYKVRAYRDMDDDKVYSSFSDIVGGTIPIINVTSVALDKTAYTLILGNSITLTAAITPVDAENQSVVWKSSDTNVATVDKTGNVTSINAGTAVITVTTVDGKKTADCTITVKNANIKGIDVSKWQGSIKWDLVKEDGIEFAMIRSTYGSSSVDPMFETNYAAAKSNEIAVGVYHYSYATTEAKAAAEVEFFLSKLKGKTLEYPVCIDIEDSSQSVLGQSVLTNIVLTYLNKLKSAGYYPIIYSNKTWFTTKLDDTQLSDYDHWLAQWGTSFNYTGRVGMWQYSSTGTVNGISGSVDLDTAFIDYEARIKLLGLNGF